jgi:uracil phosphoribosyltransferase
MSHLVVDHPLVQHWLTSIRRREVVSDEFRRGAETVSLLLIYEATRHWTTRLVQLETPLGPTRKPALDDPQPVAVPILRAGLAMLPGFLQLFPRGHVGMLGMARDEHTLKSRTYYKNLPWSIRGNRVLLLDPMLATGGSLSQAVTELKGHEPAEICAVCLLAAPEGLQRIEADHPDTRVIVACVDERLNSVGYILPGLGDAGDRLFGTLQKETMNPQDVSSELERSSA